MSGHQRSTSGGHLRTGRSTSVDFFSGLDGSAESKGAFKDSLRPFRHRHSLSNGLKSLNAPSAPLDSKPTWRDRKGDKRQWHFKRQHAVTAAALTTLGFVACGTMYVIAGSRELPDTITLDSFMSASNPQSAVGFSGACNPWTQPGRLHADYSEPSNNYWQSTDGSCPAPRYVKELRTGNFDQFGWMQDKTVLLVGDSIERDHVSLFCSLLGGEVETVRPNHKYGVEPESFSSVERKRKWKDRSSRIAYKGMQESTLPHICYIPEVNFLLANVYHFGLDQENYWKHLDQYHEPGLLEERFSEAFYPFVDKLKEDGRFSAPDMVEFSSAMFDLARWAQQDIAANKSTEDPLSKERLEFYESRASHFLTLVKESWPGAIKTWRGVTKPEDQAAELDYFNDRFGHTAHITNPYFAPRRVDQIAAIMSKKLSHLVPKAATVKSRLPFQKRKLFGSSATAHVVHSPWSKVVEGVPAHQLDRLHGGDIATPGAVLWADIMLWHLQHRSS